MQYLVKLGRQPELSLAELEAKYGTSGLKSVSENFALLDEKPDIDSLGGSIKVCVVVDEISGSWQDALESSSSEISKLAKKRSAKINLGLSIYGERVSAKEIQREMLSLKKSFREKSISIRIIPNKSPSLNSAQVIHNKLTTDKGMEICLVKDGKKFWVAQTLQEQNIDAFTLRDRSKPYRDAKVGMLPPKLALLMINLAQIDEDTLLLDPFCGSGTVLIEAINQGISANGSDISTEMVQASIANVNWFKEAMKIELSPLVEMADATKHHWSYEIGAVVAETYLGPPLNKIPTPGELNKIIETVDNLHREFLINIHSQLKPGASVVLAVPQWMAKNKNYTLPLLDDLEKIGYTHQSFIHVNELLYARDDQVVGRRILALKRK